MIKHLESLKVDTGWGGSAFFFLVSEQTFCGEPVDAFTVNWTALYFVFFIQWTFLIFFCIHCDRTAQEVACARIVKKKKKLVFFFLIRVRNSVFFFSSPLLICQSDCTVCFESRIRKKPNPVPSHLVDQRQYGREWSRFSFQVWFNCRIFWCCLFGLNVLPDHTSLNKAF